MHVRRELDHINKHYDRHQRVAGESVVWYEFLPIANGSTYDDVYDESPRGDAGLSYKPGVVIPTLYVGELEDANRAIPEARQPVQNLEVVISFKAMLNSGVTDPWEYQPRLKDLFFYDGRFYMVINYRVRGRLRGEVLVAVDGKEVYVDQEMMNDVFLIHAPRNEDLPWPDTLPTVS